MKLKYLFSMLALSVMFAAGCEQKLEITPQERTHISDRVSETVYNYRSFDAKQRRSRMQELCCIELDEDLRKKIAKRDIARLVRILRNEDDDVAKYWLITFIGNLGKYAKPAGPLLLQIKKQNSFAGSPGSKKPYMLALKIAMKKIGVKKPEKK